MNPVDPLNNTIDNQDKNIILKTQFIKTHAKTPKIKETPENRGNHFYYGRQGVLNDQKSKEIQVRTIKTSRNKVLISAQDYEKINDESTVFETSTRKHDNHATPVVSFKDSTQVASEKRTTENQFVMVVEDERNRTMIDQNLSGVNYSPGKTVNIRNKKIDRHRI